MMFVSLFGSPDGKVIRVKGMFDSDVFKKTTLTWIINGKQVSSSKMIQFKYIKTLAVLDTRRDLDVKHVFV
jgi:hypothetical protein